VFDLESDAPNGSAPAATTKTSQPAKKRQAVSIESDAPNAPAPAATTKTSQPAKKRQAVSIESDAPNAPAPKPKRQQKVKGISFNNAVEQSALQNLFLTKDFVPGITVVDIWHDDKGGSWVPYTVLGLYGRDTKKLLGLPIEDDQPEDIDNMVTEKWLSRQFYKNKTYVLRTHDGGISGNKLEKKFFGKQEPKGWKIRCR